MELPSRGRAPERTALSPPFRPPRSFASPVASRFMASLDSFRLVNAQDSALAAPEKIKIGEAANGDTPETLAARMGFLPQWLDQFLILNGLERDAALVPGQ